MIVSKKKPNSSPRLLTIVSVVPTDNRSLIAANDRARVECPKQRPTAIARESQTTRSLWRSLLMWFMDGFALYATSVYSMPEFELYDLESRDTAENEEERRFKEAIAEAEKFWAGCF